MSLKQNEMHFQAEFKKKKNIKQNKNKRNHTWYLYSNVDVTWTIPVSLKSILYNSRWKIFWKSISKVLEKTINKDLNNVCAIVHGLQLDLYSRLEFNCSSSSKKIRYLLSRKFS